MENHRKKMLKNNDFGVCRCGQPAITEIDVVEEAHDSDNLLGIEAFCSKHKPFSLYDGLVLSKDPFPQFNKKNN